MISEEEPDKQVLNAAKRLKQMIAREVQAQKHMTKAIGSLEMIISNSRRVKQFLKISEHILAQFCSNTWNDVGFILVDKLKPRGENN